MPVPDVVHLASVSPAFANPRTRSSCIRPRARLAHSRPGGVLQAVELASGYAIKINVRDGQLHIHDGLGRNRRELRIHRTAGLKRLVILGRDGYISLDAIGWLADTGAAFLHLDRDAKLLATSTASAPAVPTLRRAQALAAANTTGLEAARHLLAHKVQGQTILLPELPGGAGRGDPPHRRRLPATAAPNNHALNLQPRRAVRRHRPPVAALRHRAGGASPRRLARTDRAPRRRPRHAALRPEIPTTPPSPRRPHAPPHLPRLRSAHIPP